MRNTWKVLIALGIIGIVLMISGFAMGASTSLYVNSSGIHFMESLDYQNVNQRNLEPIKDIDLNVLHGDIEFVQSDNYGYDIISNNTSDLEYSMKNGRLSIQQKINFIWNLSFWGFDFDSRKVEIKVYLPPAAIMNNLDINLSSGNIDINNLNSQQLVVSLASGNADISHGVFDRLEINEMSGRVSLDNVEVNDLELVLTSGQIIAENMLSRDTVINITSGDMDLAGTFLGNSRINLISGDIKMMIDGTEADYNHNVSCVSGSVYIDGNKIQHGNKNTNASNTLDISLTSGRAKIDFQ